MSLTKKAKSRPGLSILLWGTLVAALCGFSGFSEPLDIVLRAARGKFINHQPSGKVVIVEVDDKHITGGDSDEKSKLYHAELITTLAAKGAKRIIVSMDASGYSDSPGDRALIAALQRSKTIFNILPIEDAARSEQKISKPADEFLRYADLAVNKLSENELLFLSSVEDFSLINNKIYYSVANYLQIKNHNIQGSLELDTSMDTKNISRYNSESVTDFDGVFAEKYIVFENYFRSDLKKYTVLNNKNITIASILALTIETALKGNSVKINWVLSFFAVLILSFCIIFLKANKFFNRIQAVMIASTLVVPIWLDDNLIFTETAPALILLIWTVIGHSWMAFNLKRSRLNSSTGFANLNALRDLELPVNACLIVARIQNFAEICAILPHDKQDELAVHTVQRLSLGADGAEIYQGDDGVFAWVMSDDRQTPVHDTLEGLHALFGSPVQIDSHRLDLSLTFGIDKTSDRSVSNRFGSALVAAKEAADAHMRWKEYDAVALDTAEWKLSLVGELDEAIDKGQIWVAYQPKIDVVTGAISGAEALVRWSHPIRGEVGPVDFVIAAEAQNRISKLTTFVLDEALGIAAQVRRTNPEFTMAVNLSGRLLDAPNMIGVIETSLARHDYPADNLTLEITESAAIESNATTKAFMATLRQIGVKISIDDYGTGFSTLDYVTSIPASEIKIDRRFVSQMQTSQSDRVVVNSTIQLAHQLGRLAVAEGVEDAETLASLGSMGCDVAQGYFISKPLTHQALFAILAKQVDAQQKLAG